MARDHHGPSAREQQVLDLLDEGLPLNEIATKLNLQLRYVEQVVRSLGAPKGDSWHSEARQGSAMLASALRRHHPERCGGAL